MAEPQAADFLHFYREYRPALMAFFLRRVQNHADAEDLTQEVYVRISAKSGEALQSADAYVFQVAANLLRDRARKRKVRDDFAISERQAEQFGIETLDPFRVSAGNEELQKLVAAIDELPDKRRRIFLLFRYENLTQRMIAESLGISQSSVEKHVQKAMAHLIKRLGARR